MATRRRAMPPVAYALLAALTISILSGLLTGSAAFAHERDEERHSLDAAAAERALRAADWLVERARESETAVAPLPADADPRALHRWLTRAGDLTGRAALEDFREHLAGLGYDHGGEDTLILWDEDIAAVLTAYAAEDAGLAGRDTAPLWEELESISRSSDDPAARERAESLRRRIELSSVTEEEAAAVRPHRNRIESLLRTAREWNR